MKGGRLRGTAFTVTGKTLVENIEGHETTDREMIRSFDAPLVERAGFLVMKGNLFDFAIMKTSVISDDFRKRYLSEKGREGVFEGRAVVFDGSDDYHARINDPALEIDQRSILVIRGAGPVGWPGSAEVVNMQPPDRLLQQGIASLPTIGDGRQSCTSDSPSILNASPESAVGGGLSWLRTGDVIRIDLNQGRCDALVPDDEIARHVALRGFAEMQRALIARFWLQRGRLCNCGRQHGQQHRNSRDRATTKIPKTSHAPASLIASIAPCAHILQRGRKIHLLVQQRNSVCH